MEREDDLVTVLRSAARVGSSEDRGVLEWRQLLEQAAMEIEQLRAALAHARADTAGSGDAPDIIDIVDVRTR